MDTSPSEDDCPDGEQNGRDRCPKRARHLCQDALHESLGPSRGSWRARKALTQRRVSSTRGCFSKKAKEAAVFLAYGFHNTVPGVRQFRYVLGSFQQ